jgi:3-hydroxybutyrate dehydrogenase
MTRFLTGKTALVTGSTSGIGLGIAHALAGAGAHIVFNGFGDAAEIEKLQRDTAAQFDVKTGFHAADMSLPAQIRDMVAYAESFADGLDILVNNAGVQHVAKIEDFPDEKWDAILAINLSSNFHAIKAAIGAMKKRNWGRIVNIASAHGLVASAEKSAYVTAKHGVIGLTKTVALEAALTGVTCNAICPGWVLTPLVQKQVDAKAAALKLSDADAKKELLREKTPSLEFVTPAQLGELAVFLCSDAAANVRGVAWNMDGGWVAQ